MSSMYRLIRRVLRRRVRTIRFTALKNDNMVKLCEQMYKNSTVIEIKKELAAL